MQEKYLSCVPGVDGKIHPSASLVTAYAALRLRDGFSHPHQEHIKATYSLLSKTLNNQCSLPNDMIF